MRWSWRRIVLLVLPENGGGMDTFKIAVAGNSYGGVVRTRNMHDEITTMGDGGVGIVRSVEW